MTGRAKASRWRQTSDRGSRMARVAPLMRDLHCRMRRFRLGQGVTGGATSPGRVMVLMTIRARDCRWPGAQRHRRRVTAQAGSLRVHLVPKLDCSRLRRETGNRDRHGHRPWRRVCLGLMARRALRRRRCVVVAGRAAERTLESETTVGGTGPMTSKAGELFVRRVWKAVTAHADHRRCGHGPLRLDAVRRDRGERQHHHSRADQTTRQNRSTYPEACGRGASSYGTLRQSARSGGPDRVPTPRATRSRSARS